MGSLVETSNLRDEEPHPEAPEVASGSKQARTAGAIRFKRLIAPWRTMTSFSYKRKDSPYFWRHPVEQQHLTDTSQHSGFLFRRSPRPYHFSSSWGIDLDNRSCHVPLGCGRKEEWDQSRENPTKRRAWRRRTTTRPDKIWESGTRTSSERNSRHEGSCSNPMPTLRSTIPTRNRQMPHLRRKPLDYCL